MANTIGIVSVAACAASVAAEPTVIITLTWIDRQCQKVIVLASRPAIFDLYVLSLNVADFLEAPLNGTQTERISFGRSWGKKSDHRHCRPLRTCHDRPSRRAAEKRDELAPLHGVPIQVEDYPTTSSNEA
jgi:hypothetical protein